MAMLSKRVKAIREKLEPGKAYAALDAFKLLKDCAKVKFNETVDVAVNLGVDARKSDQNVRGAVVLPKGTGKTVRIAVFAEGENAAKATAAGADVVGMDDLVEQMKGGDLNYDVVIATPNAMRIVGKLGQILGPKGLMPNPKVGTVTPDVTTAVNNAKAGQARFRSDKNGIIHCAIGKADFSESDLKANLEALLVELKRVKPSTAKGAYFKKVTLSTTMGPGVLLDLSSVTT